MNASSIRILYVDDYPLDRTLVRDALLKEAAGFELIEAASRAELEAALAKGKFDLVLSDLNILGFEGVQVIEMVRAKDPRLPVIIVTGTGSEEMAVKAIKSGAADYVIKSPKHIEHLPHTIENALERKRLRDERERREAELRRSYEELRINRIALETNNAELRRTQEELEILHARYVDLYDFAPVGYLTINEEGIILRTNLTAAKMLGVERSRLVKKSLTRFIAKEDQDVYILHRKQLFETRAPQAYELRMTKKDAVPLWVNIQAFTAQESDNTTVCRLTLSDITEDKRAEQALAVSEEKYRNLVEKSGASVATVDIEGKFSFVNDVFCQLVGYSKQELIGNPFFRFLHPDEKEGLLKFFSKAAKNPGARPILEFRAVHKDGHPIWCYTQPTPLFVQDQVTGFNAIIQDITELKQAEQALRQSLAEKETLLREVHHRVKNNLQSIIFLLQGRVEQVSDQETVLMLKGLQEQARSMALVYEHLFQSESLAEVQMREYLTEVSMNVMSAFDARQRVELVLECEGINLNVSDAMPCGLIVTELLTNALKHAFPPSFQGAPQLLVSFSEHDNYCELSVRDNGVGLPEGMDWQTLSSMGLKLVKLWATHQMGGTLEINCDAGTAIQITFRKNWE